MSKTDDGYEPTPDEIESVRDALNALSPWCEDADPVQVLRENRMLAHNWERMRLAVEVGCQPCIHAAIFGWWGNPLIKGIGAGTHCGGCHRSWRSIKEAHCKVCHEQFSSNEAAEQHWVNDGHVHPSTVPRRGPGNAGKKKFCQTETDFGPVWVLCRFIEAREGRA